MTPSMPLVLQHKSPSLRTTQYEWRSSPGGQQVADRVPGADEHFGLVASQHCGFAGWYLNIYIHVHGLAVVI